MPYVIPNAVDTVTNPKYYALDQAEPDSLDFEVLGDNTSGVIFDGEVQYLTTGNGTTVIVKSGVVLLKGVVYTTTGNSALLLSSGLTSDPVFELIVVRLTNGLMTPTVLLGTQSASNPSFPPSRSSSLTISGRPEFNPLTDVLLAAIYRNGTSSITEKNIVDKRKMVQTSIPYRSSSAPLATVGNQGDLYFQTGEMPNGESGVYVKKDSSTWTQLAKAPISPGVPIGTVITWIAVTPPDASIWLECNGATNVSSITYSALATLLGTTYGPTGNNTFTLPNFKGMYLAGKPIAGVMGTAVGNVDHKVTLVASDLPFHRHNIDHAHIDGETDDAGEHSHGTGVAEVGFATKRSFYAPEGTVGYVAPADSQGWFGSEKGDGYADSYQVDYNLVGTGESAILTPLPGLSIWHQDRTGVRAAHKHINVSIPTSSGLQSEAGSSTPNEVNVQPRTMYVTYYIRAL